MTARSNEPVVFVSTKEYGLPLRSSGGLKVLVEEYAKAGGKPVSLTDVRVHELLLVLHWLKESWREYQQPEARGQGPDFYESQLRSLLRRAVGYVDRG